MLLCSNGFVHHHPSNRLPVFLLLRRDNSVRRGIHGKTVHHFLHRIIFKLSIVLRIILLKNRDETTHRICRHVTLPCNKSPATPAATITTGSGIFFVSIRSASVATALLIH